MTGPSSLFRTVLAVGMVAAVAGCAGSASPAGPGGEAAGYHPYDSGEAAAAYADLGRQYLLRGSLDLALARLRKAIRLDPGLARAHHDLAVVYGEMGNNEAAEEQYRRALELDPKDPAIRYNYATLLYNQQRHGEAEEQFRQVVDRPDAENRAQAYERLGLAALAQGDAQRAEGYFGKALGIDPNLSRALLETGRMAFEAGRLVQARSLAQRHLEAHRDTPEGLWLAILVDRALGDSAALGDHSRRLRVKFPDSRQARQLYADRRPEER